MAIFELRIPPHFFDSAKEENHFESVSERIAKSFLIDILNINDIKRGNPELQEPDYIFGEQGYEVTFAIKQSLIPQLKGVRELNGTPNNIEESKMDKVRLSKTILNLLRKIPLNKNSSIIGDKITTDKK